MSQPIRRKFRWSLGVDGIIYPNESELIVNKDAAEHFYFDIIFDNSKWVLYFEVFE